MKNSGVFYFSLMLLVALPVSAAQVIATDEATVKKAQEFKDKNNEEQAAYAKRSKDVEDASSIEDVQSAMSGLECGDLQTAQDTNKAKKIADDCIDDHHKKICKDDVEPKLTEADRFIESLARSAAQTRQSGKDTTKRAKKSQDGATKEMEGDGTGTRVSNVEGANEAASSLYGNAKEQFEKCQASYKAASEAADLIAKAEFFKFNGCANQGEQRSHANDVLKLNKKAAECADDAAASGGAGNAVDGTKGSTDPMKDQGGAGGSTPQMMPMPIPQQKEKEKQKDPEKKKEEEKKQGTCPAGYIPSGSSSSGSSGSASSSSSSGDSSAPLTCIPDPNAQKKAAACPAGQVANPGYNANNPVAGTLPCQPEEVGSTDGTDTTSTDSSTTTDSSALATDTTTGSSRALSRRSLVNSDAPVAPSAVDKAKVNCSPERLKTLKAGDADLLTCAQLNSGAARGSKIRGDLQQFDRKKKR